MISIDQVRVLEQKVKQAIQFIHNLKQENTLLKSKLADYEVRIQELESLLLSLKDNQTIIESGIQNAIGQLDLLEDEGQSESPETVNAESSGQPVTPDSIEEEEYQVSSNQESEQESLEQNAEPESDSTPLPAPVLVETIEAIIQEQYTEPGLETSSDSVQEDPVSAQQDFFLEDEPAVKDKDEDEDPQQGLGIF